MSLVAYGESDDSGEEDVDQAVVQKKGETNEDFKAAKLKREMTPSTSLKTEPNKVKLDDDEQNKTRPKSIGTLFSSMPSPWMSSVSWVDKSLGKKAGAKDKTVKISLPSVGDNSDSDDDEFQKKTKMPVSDFQKPSGLFSLLPKPKHSVVVKENNPNRPVAKLSNRPLIPDSLRRKQVKKQTPQKSTTQAKKTESDNDSDDEIGGSFFSWSEKTSSTDADLGIPTTSGGGSLPSSNQEQEYTMNKKTENILTSMASTSSTLSEKIESTGNLESDQSIPIADPNMSSEYFEHKNHYMDNTASSSEGYSYQGRTSSGYPTVEYGYNDPNYACTNYDYYNSEHYNQASIQPKQSPVDWQNLAQSSVQETPDQWKKILGRKRGHEEINIIDVNADDQKDFAQSWKTNYQREDEYKPQSKGNLPSSQQRRKHQITYLAFQAKEKEWELRNQWSANSQTRRQTQSKYGF